MVNRIPFLVYLAFFSFNSYAQVTVDSSRIVRVLSFNILHGATTKGDFDLDYIAEVIKKSKPDFVTLQEVDFKTNRAKNYDLATELGWRTKMVPLFARAMYYDDGEYGEGILSKHSIVSSRNVSLPYSEGKEPRAAVEVTTVLPSGDTISIIGTHLDHLKEDFDRIQQVRKINEVFLENKHPTLLTGDLNDVSGSRAISILETEWTPSYNKDSPEPTFPSNNPVIKIDYVMAYPGNRWKVISTEAICDEIASDHCGYLVVLELRE